MAVDKLVDSTQLNADLTAIADAVREKGGTSALLAFPDGFVNAIDAIQTGGGGGGATLIASGTYTGTGTYPGSAGQGIFVGTRMPQTDFYVRFIARSDSEFPYDTNYKYAYGIALVFSEFGHFDLSTVGDGKQMISDITFNINNGGTITAADAGMPIIFIDSVRNATAKNTQIPNNCKIDRRSDGFYFRLFNSNVTNKYESGITYDWKVVYFGSNPSSDIVSI